MKKLFVILNVLCVSILAMDLPVAETTRLEVGRGQFTTITFPFDIAHIEKSPFVTKATIPANASPDAVIDSQALLNASALPQPAGKKKGKSVSKSKNITMKKDRRSISIYPYKLGSTELVVMGHKKFDMHIKIIVKEKAGADHFNFKDFTSRDTVDVAKSSRFEMVPHEKVISKLIKYVYNNKTPPGFTVTRMSKTYHRKGMRFKLHKKVVGEKYQANEWIIKNTGKGTVTLYEEMFYIDGIYAITFDNNVLKRGESTRMIVVQRKDRG
jgi:hypothetical protein